MSVSDVFLEIFVGAFLNVPSFIIQSEISSSTRGYIEGSHIVGYEIFLHDTFLEFALVNQVNAVCKLDSTVLF